MSKVAGVLGFAAIASATWASSSSAAAPAASSALPECWSSCFASNGVTSESAACGNAAVDSCIHDTCSEELDQKYWSWYDSYCGSSSSSSIPVSTYVPSSDGGPWSSSVPASTSVPSTSWGPVSSSVPWDGPSSSGAWPVPSSSYSYSYSSSWSSEGGPVSSSIPWDGSSSSYSGWGSSISQAYPVPSSSSWGSWSSSASYSASYYPSSSIVQPVSSSTVPSGTPTPTCWSECFTKAGITHESELCGNTEVDKCIHDTCCEEENKAYWTWYDSYCPAPSSSTPFSPVSSSAYPYPSSSSYSYSWSASSSEPFSPISSSYYPSGSSSYSWGVVSSSAWGYPSSSACAFPSSSYIYRSSWVPSSSIPFEPVSSSSYSWGVSSSVPFSPVSSSGYPSGSSYSWGAVSSSVVAYPSGSSYSWGAISSSYVVSASVSSSYPSSTPTVDCWNKCFAENDITSEEELCGNTAVDKCISETCSCEKDKQYWQWYDSFCTATPSSSIVSPVTSTVPTISATGTPGCWETCFAEASITSESELCGNTAVDKCIHDTCSPAEDKAYWQWYNAYCPATTTITTITIPPTSPTSPVSTPTGGSGNCWNACFAEFDVTSESALCGNDEVSKCIHDTCSGALDQAYWSWYDSYCAPASSSVITITTTAVVTPVPSGYPAGGPTGEPSVVTTTIVSTLTYPATAKESSPVTGFPVPPASSPAGPAGYSAPASPAAPGGYSAPASSPVAPVGYSTPASSPVGAYGFSTGAAQPTGAYASPSASTWAPVPATGAGAANKPGFVLAVAVAFVALF